MNDLLTLWLPPLACGLGGLALGWLWRGRALGATQARLHEAELTLAQTQANAETAQARLVETEAALTRERAERIPLETTAATLRAELAGERAAASEKHALLEQARTRLSDTFEALSAEALRRNNATFLELAALSLKRTQEAAKNELDQRQNAIADLLAPVRDSLAKVDRQLHEIEKNRTGTQEALASQLRALMDAHGALRRETHQLSASLRSPTVRGRWGEVQLRRVVELAGMVDHCDFIEQAAADAGRLRPDLLVQLPSGTRIVVDAKAPLAAYLEAMEASDDATRRAGLLAHAAAVRTHIQALCAKAYWEQFDPTPEFVVLFLPGESFFSAALEHDPTLIEYGSQRRVILATPTTLISLLKAVFLGWRQQRLAHNAQMMAELGRELYRRIAGMGGHLERMGRSLNQSVEHYNKLVSNTERRVLVTARRFCELEPGHDPLPAPEPLEQSARPLQSSELAAPEPEPPAS